jgi:hypothetical protein
MPTVQARDGGIVQILNLDRPSFMQEKVFDRKRTGVSAMDK